MPTFYSIFLRSAPLFFLFCLLLFCSLPIGAQIDGKAFYEGVRSFELTGRKVDVTGLVLKRDRGVMTFTGTFYFTAPLYGEVTGAVFIGQGNFHADLPPSDFEKSNVKRLLKADVIESSFKTAVLRFSDNTFALIGKNAVGGAAPPQAVKLAAELNPRILKETGANIAARTALSILNNETPGFFFANFDGGDRGRFSYLFDAQSRIPTANFDINAGEKGLIFTYRPEIYFAEVWTAFAALDDYARNTATYSDTNDLVDITAYDMQLDLTDPRVKLGLRTKVKMRTRSSGLRAIPFAVGESLGEAEDQRLKKQMHLKSVRMDGKELTSEQEDWQGGFTVFLPEMLAAGKDLEMEFELEGDFMRQPDPLENCHYPRSNETWYPRHGYLDRSTFDFTFIHPKKLKIASVGVRQSETPDPETKDMTVTRYTMQHPVALVTFALAPFERHVDTIKWDDGSKPIPIEFNSMPGGVLAIKEDFIMAELNNSVRYFQKLFGPYPYENFGAAFHPYGFGQGFPSMLMIPNTDRANKYTYAFISHETAHQWWGNIVSWRSYRDQWLSEGFAEYSAVLYTRLRQNPKAAINLVDQMRQSLREPPVTQVSYGSGTLNDIGPIILGHRLSTRKSYGAYQALIYNKGALVLRMLHFLMSDPATNDDKEFFAMMKDFVERYRNGVASSDDFRAVANEHFARTPIAQRYRLTDLNWFFQQWVYETEMPSYKLDYRIDDQPDGSVIVSGNVTQEGVPDKFFMVLPLVFTFGDGKFAGSTVAAAGLKTPFKIKLAARPFGVELDPQKWILSGKTT
jgi:Peptidase family M1 domain